jgi:hypothetical protein
VKSPGTIVVCPPVPALPSSPVHPRRKVPKAVDTPSSGPASIGAVYDLTGVPLGQVSKAPLIDLANPSLGRKRSALAPPSTGAPSSSKALRSSHSSSAINRMSSAMSTSTSLPSPLMFSPSLLARMVLDPPEDQVLVLLDPLEFAIERGNLDDARRRIRALRTLR